MLEYIRFAFFAILLLAGLCFEIVAVIGVNRFGFSLNRLHAASIGDTMGLICIVLACVIKAGSITLALKLITVLLFMLLTCPMSSHLIALLVYRTDPSLEKEAQLWHK